MASATVANITPTAILNICADRGIDIATLLSDSGINPSLIKDQNARIPLEQVFTLWEEAQRRTEDEMIALRTAELAPFGAFKVVDYIFAASSTLGEGVSKASSYYRLINGGFELHLRAQKDQAHFELCNSIDPKNLSRQYIEYIFACVLVRLRSATGMNWTPREVTLTYSMPRKISEYHRVFQAPLRFNRPVNRLVFDRCILDMPNPQSDPLLCDLLEYYAQRLLKHLPAGDDFLSELRKVLRKGIRYRNTSLTATARELGVSRRSLQRRLDGQGTSYREILDRLRCEIAMTFLEQQQPDIEEIAFLLGFSEPSSFYRAFKRWTGKTPQHFLQVL